MRDQCVRQAADQNKLEKMMYVCDCFKMWQKPSAQDEEDGEDDDG